MRRVNVMGVPVIPFASYGEAAGFALRRVAEKKKTLCVTVNAETVVNARRDREFARVVREAGMTTCDGSGVQLAARVLLGLGMERCTGVDLFLHLLSGASRENMPVFLLGASAESSAKARARIEKEFPGLKIAGSRDGYFNDDEEVVSQINRSGAALVFAALGSPRQELWFARRMDAMDALFFMGIGGTLDVIGGNARRAPVLFRKLGLEFMYRLFADPSRAVRQSALLTFVFLLVSEKLSRGRPRRGR